METCPNCKTRNLSDKDITGEITDVKQCLNCGWNNKHNDQKKVCNKHEYPVYYWSNCKVCWDIILGTGVHPSMVLGK